MFLCKLNINGTILVQNKANFDQTLYKTQYGPVTLVMSRIVFFAMGSFPQRQISFIFDSHGVFFSSFAIENLISKKMIPRMPYLMLDNVDMSG